MPERSNGNLAPRSTWHYGNDYDVQAQTLAGMFTENFRAFEADADVVRAGPRQRT